jgi:hypothetical protein
MSDRTPGWLRAAGLVLVAAVFGLSGLPARADDKKQETAVAAQAAGDVRTTSALSRVPADTAFFTSYLRNKEQLDRFYHSNAYKAIRKLPLVDMLVKQAMADLKKEGGPLEMLEQFTKDKQNKELLDLLLGALSDEVFIWGGKGWTELLSVYGKANGAGQFAALEGLKGIGNLNRAQFRAYLTAVQKYRQQIQVPGLVFGFKIKDSKKVVAHLKRFQTHLAKHLEDNEQLKGKLKLKGDFLTLQLDGSMVPWDDIPLNEFEDKRGEFDDLFKHLKKLTLTFSLGVKDDYVLLGMTSTLADVENLSKGKTLAQQDELRVLDKFASKKVTSVAYASKEFRTAAMGNRDLTEMSQGFKQAIEGAPIKEERKKALLKDGDELFGEMKKAMAKFALGSQVSFTFMSESGYEGYSYDFGNHDRVKGINTKLVEHMGGNPIFAAAFGFRVDGTAYAFMRKWAMKFYEHGEAVFLDMADNETKDIYRKISKPILPLIKQLDETTTKLFLPSLKESGFGIVIDGKWSSKQWHASLPKLDKAMPALEVGLLVGLSDGKKFAQALSEYRKTLNEMWAKIRKLEIPDADQIPEFQIPQATMTQGKNGTLYTWKLPEESGLDKQFLLTLGVGKDVAVFTLSKEHAERLLAPTKLKTEGLALPTKRDLVGAMVFNFPALVDVAQPWVDFMLNTLVGIPGDDEEAAKKAKAMAAEWSKNAKELARIAKCFKGVTAGSYLEDGKLVTHGRIVIVDLPEAPK